MWAVLVVMGTREQLQRAASRGRAARPAPASAMVCVDDENMEVEEMEASQQQHLILVIQVCEGFTVQCDQQEEV